MYRLCTICGKGKRKMEEIRWYEKLNYTETKDIIKEKLQNMSRDFVAIGFYLKLIRDKSLFLEDGYKSIWEFAEDNYGIKRSTASRWMAMNDRFSKNGNTPILSEEYILSLIHISEPTRP